MGCEEARGAPPSRSPREPCGVPAERLVLYRRCCRIWPLDALAWMRSTGRCGLCGEVPLEEPTTAEIDAYERDPGGVTVRAARRA